MILPGNGPFRALWLMHSPLRNHHAYIEISPPIKYVFWIIGALFAFFWKENLGMLLTTLVCYSAVRTCYPRCINKMCMHVTYRPYFLKTSYGQISFIFTYNFYDQKNLFLIICQHLLSFKCILTVLLEIIEIMYVIVVLI